MLSMRQTNQEQNAECSLENPQQLNHPTRKKHTLNANNISNKQPSLNGALAHPWRYILNISGMFKYIPGTNWNAFSCIFCFFRCTFVNMTPPPTIVSPPTQSLKEAYLKIWKHCMLPMYVCLQDMCLCIFFGIRRCKCLFLFVFWLVCCWCLDVTCFYFISVLSLFFSFV